MEKLDWSLIHSFLAVAEAGSLSAAARATGISQPTLGRHIRQIESALSMALFQRTATGQRLTDGGAALLPAAEDMRAAAMRLGLVAMARQEAVTGTVRITASRVVSHHILPPILAQIREAEPGIALELVPTDTAENLLFHAADIALRMFRPTQGDLTARRLTDLPIGLYAARDYLGRKGTPRTPEELLTMDFVGFDTSDLIIRTMQGMGISVDRNFFPVRCDDQLVHVNLIRAGCGVGGLLRAVGDGDPALQRLDGLFDLPALPVWLTAAPGLRDTPRIARVWDLLAEGFGRRLP